MVGGVVLGGRALLHAASARHTFDDGVTARMELWYSLGNEDSSAYLYVLNGQNWGEIKIPMWDWAHWVRTSLYRTPDAKIAVAVPYGGPPTYLIPSYEGPVEGWNWRLSNSASWTYLGAFDWRGQHSPGGRDRRFDFIPASEQAECIPMGGGDKGKIYQPRTDHQQDSCPAP
jgi:hypothetical protein